MKGERWEEGSIREACRAVALLALGVSGLAAGARAQAPHDECAGALPLPVGTTPGTNEGSTTSPGTTCSFIGNDVWYAFTTAEGGLLTLSTDAASGGSADFDTILALYGGTCDALLPVACNDDTPATLQSTIQVIVTPGQGLFVRVGGFLGDVGDFVLAMQVQKVEPVLNDECAGAMEIAEGETTGTTLGATTSADPVGCGPAENDIWFRYTASDTGLLVVTTASLGGGAEFDTVLAAYTGTCDALDEIACNDDVIVFVLESEIAFGVTQGQSYLIRLGGFAGAFGGYNLVVDLTPGQPAPNDECSNAQLVASDTVSGDNLSAFNGDDSGSCSVAGKNVWFLYVPPADGQLTASLLNDGGSADFDTVLAAYTGTCDSLVEVACNDDISFPAFLQSEISVPVAFGVPCFLSVGGFFGATGHFTLSLQLQPGGGEPFVSPFNGHTYALTPSVMTWSAARDYAAAAGGHLVTLGDPFEQLLLQLHFTGPVRHWIGLTDEGSEGTFAWLTGEPLGFTSWAPGQPDDACGPQSEDYVALDALTGEWFDSTDGGCAEGLHRGIIELDTSTPFASCTPVGEGCADGKPPQLLGGLPALGQMLSLIVIDPATESTGVLYASNVPAAPTIAFGCAIQLDAASRFVVAPIDTDATGLDTVAVGVPFNPSLVGVSFALQAFLVRDKDQSPAMTNGLHMVLGF